MAMRKFEKYDLSIDPAAYRFAKPVPGLHALPSAIPHRDKIDCAPTWHETLIIEKTRPVKDIVVGRRGPASALPLPGEKEHIEVGYITFALLA